MLVVADSSPLILLGRVERLALLPALYHEVVGQGEHRPGVRELVEAPWMDLAPVDASDPLFLGLRSTLDLGEAASLVLARARNADLILMDDRAARRQAVSLGLAVKGTLGILVTAKREGLVQEVQPLLAALVSQGAWLSQALRRRVLAAAGEEPTPNDSEGVYGGRADRE